MYRTGDDQELQSQLDTANAKLSQSEMLQQRLSALETQVEPVSPCPDLQPSALSSLLSAALTALCAAQRCTDNSGSAVAEREGGGGGGASAPLQQGSAGNLPSAEG
jgi:hypothetical protein